MSHLFDAIGASLVCFVIFGSFAAIFIAPRFFKSQERQKMQDTIRAAIERGQSLPPEMLDAMTRDVRPAPSAARDIRSGIVWLGIAAGLAAFGYALGYMPDDHLAYPILGLAAVPGFIGLAFLIASLFNRGKAR